MLFCRYCIMAVLYHISPAARKGMGGVRIKEYCFGLVLWLVVFPVLRIFFLQYLKSSPVVEVFV